MENRLGENAPERPDLPIVFVGPSIPLHEARQIVNADFRSPCRRGDLANIPGGAVVGLIDGVFHQNEAVSPREIVYALQRGIQILGSSSMGALRAAEVPGVQGIGHVYEMYKQGAIDSDDEVALVFDPDRFVPLTVPLVNVRYAADRLLSSGTITAPVSARILAAAQKLHYRERTYRLILREAGLENKADAEDLLNLLKSFDLKRDDARLLLERLANIVQNSANTAAPRHQSPSVQSAPDYGPGDHLADVKVPGEMDAAAPVLIWETGDAIPFMELVLFLKLTGKFLVFARNAIARLQCREDGYAVLVENMPPMEELKADFHRLCRTWGWKTEQEVHVTMTDLGIGFKDVLKQIRDEAILHHAVLRFARDSSELFLKALRCEMLFNDLALKREAMRYGSLKMLGAGETHPDQEMTEAAKLALCGMHGVPSWQGLQRQLNDLGVEETEIQRFLATLCNARETASRLQSPSFPEQHESLHVADEAFGLRLSPKSAGEQRFYLATEQAYDLVNQFKEIIGVTRVGMITGLTELEGVHVCQAARPSGVWSSSYGSGKSDTKEGAVVGAVMEEVEKWAQEQFRGEPLVNSYAVLRENEHVLDPSLLDLPYDSIYEESLEFGWHQCFDLIERSPILVPLAAIACSFNAGKNNIYYSARGARVTFSTNGLASGFALAEALVHATCEYIERHAARMCELQVENPGLPGLGASPRSIELTTLPDATRELTERLEAVGCQVGVWDITSEVRVPTFLARITQDREVARGWAAHPNPAVACRMAILEACQTIVAAVAAGREDLTVQARSLGRHERSNPLRMAAHLFWQNNDEKKISLSQIEGLATSDAYVEFDWIRQKLVEAGVKHLIAVDLTRDEIKPAHAVRVILPGLETNNPYYCGPRARVALISDMVAHSSAVS
jgi:ribosomal protein S12 methylthiotransferase accessory factor